MRDFVEPLAVILGFFALPLLTLAALSQHTDWQVIGDILLTKLLVYAAVGALVVVPVVWILAKSDRLNREGSRSGAAARGRGSSGSRL